MEEVAVESVALDRLAAVLPPDRQARLAANAERARAGFGTRTVWHVNATAHGGGVAEMLQTLLAYGRGAGIENRWLVLEADPEFFTITKRLHNMLHGEPGDGGTLAGAERGHYEAVLAANLAELVRRVAPGDIVVLHDPQTAGLARGLRQLGALVVWRCHVGRDQPNGLTSVGWGFLRPYLAHAHTMVFSRRVYAPSWVDDTRMVVIPPSIDPFAAKNAPLEAHQIAAVLTRVGLVAAPSPREPVRFTRRDGTVGVVRPYAETGGLLHHTEPPRLLTPLVVQVSRWDRLKDMTGVMTGFARAVGGGDDGGAHLMLAGPEVAGVSDDPEGALVLAECQDLWRSLPPPVKARVHLASIPMDDGAENALIVNALQRHAEVVVQKSLVEGFGLTVTEAMWKGRAVVASKVGGIQDQITDGRDGLLVNDAHDLAEFGDVLKRALRDQELRRRLGSAASARVLDEYLGDRHLGQYVDLFLGLVRDSGR